MTTIVYTEEVMTSKSPNSGAQRNIKTFTVKIMGDAPAESRGSPKHSANPNTVSKQKRFSVRQKPESSSKMSSKQQLELSYNPHTFNITAYLPHDGGKRLKVSVRWFLFQFKKKKLTPSSLSRFLCVKVSVCTVLVVVELFS